MCQIIFSGKYKDINPNSVYKNYYQNEIPTRFHFGIELIIKAFRLFRAFRLFSINPSAQSILDIGSGRGYTLYYLKKYFGYKVTAGTQLENNAYLFSKNKLGLQIFNKDLLDLNIPDLRFDFVTMWHVLEHVKYPENYIIKIKHLLKNKGRVILEVPNFNSWTRRLLNKYWLGLDLNYHLYFFDKNSLSKLLEKHGFRILKTHFFSLEYSTFTSAQSIVNWVTKTENVFFNTLQRKNTTKNIIVHIVLITITAIPAFIINLLLYFSDLGEDLLIIAERDDK